MSLLDTVNGPRDLRGLSAEQLTQLSEEIRAFLIHQVSRTGGHLGPNLGVVELTLALHRTFDSPADPIIFDTGHQSYVHKIVTGRRDGFPTLKQKNGLSGYPSRAESEHDWVENQHASASLAYAEGLAKAFRLRGNRHHVVAVIGDGALTGGMAWEALNNIAADDDLPLVVVVNDNGRSYTPTVGGLARHLTGLRTSPRYEQVLDVVKRQVNRAPLVGSAAYDVLHGIKAGLKDVLAPQGMYSDLGIKYVGPIDGHDVLAVERALQQAKQFGGPVLVHVLTHKGRGFPAAENNEEDQFHTVGQIDEVTGLPLSVSERTTWTDVFAEELERLGRADDRVVAITAAMLYPTGLHRFAASFPERTYDVGIAEQHAVTSAAGLALGGMHPVVALYATFLNRAFDQVLMDVGLHRLGVTFVLDRAGITGNDGASHNGMWDMSMLQLVPGLHLTAPRDATRLREALHRAVTIADAPSVIRYSKEKVPEDVPAVDRVGGVDVLRRSPAGDGAGSGVLVVGYGQLVGTALGVADRLVDQGIGVTVVDPVWALPVDPALVELARSHELVVTIEDNLVVGGCGSRLLLVLSEAGVMTPVRCFGIPQEYLPHASRGELLSDLGLTPQDIARSVIELVAGSTGEPAHPPLVEADRPPAEG
ncbi:1-deoxy-D-xylulose-5-phosphate synthase [Friedmanniella endophytica]|uniref:1-deoxy-D-xylulose-5-phosphate synthase n=1 Tax=Microlunatus kandeliicorticis TaxID=1759536 RepID=A0A7W3P6E0_9ACTN|nr:1-deoxy-D-xylulose-5-phosphate synthase [Microlunatus kandeliicorticis]MBA8794878.1 1-deoxy-D-xylulose-5-phosphate synthase [Microlunatus kandeliicorticis]